MSQVPFTIRRKATELDVGDVFLYEGHVYRVRRVGEVFHEPGQGNFQTLFVDGDRANNYWFPLRASTVVRVQGSQKNPAKPGADLGTVAAVLGGAFVVAGGIAYLFYSLTHIGSGSDEGAPVPTQVGTDASGNPVYASMTPGGIGVFNETTPGPLPSAGTTSGSST